MLFTSDEANIKKIIKQSMDAIVGIFALKPITNPSKDIISFKIKDEYFEKIGNSSGFLATKNGLIVTNYHPISDRTLDYKVYWNNNFYDCAIFYYDDINDLAILKLQTNKKQKFQYLELGDSSALELGSTVITIGNVLDEFQKTVSKGVVSGLSRYVKTESSYRGVLEYKGLIQTDAAINPGNSGGPLINSKGKVVGITTLAVKGVENIGLSIPINSVKKILRDLSTYGKVKNISLGIRYIIIDDLVKSAHSLPVNHGAFVVFNSANSGIIPGGLAEKSGLKEGDIILELDNQKINNSHTLSDCLSSVCVNDTIVLKVLREGKEMNFKIQIN